jgi:signal transduction histidine kinase
MYPTDLLPVDRSRRLPELPPPAPEAPRRQPAEVPRRRPSTEVSVDLSAALVACVARHAQAADERGLVLTVNSAPISGSYPHLDLAVARTYAVGVDLGTLERIAGALIEFAVEDTAWGAVAVRVTGDPARPGFEVADSGSGMPPSFLEGGSTLEVAGALAQLIGGSIRVSRRRGEGTTYRVQLPSAPVVRSWGDGAPGTPSEVRVTPTGSGR